MPHLYQNPVIDSNKSIEIVLTNSTPYISVSSLFIFFFLKYIIVRIIVIISEHVEKYNPIFTPLFIIIIL